MAAKLSPNKLLTDFLREVGEEQTETIEVGGELIRITKAEKLARNIYASAMGGMVQEFDPEASKMVTVYAPPSIQAAKLVREYTEGRPAQATTGKENETAGKRRAKQFSESAKRRLTERLNAPAADSTD